jgi:hypothetical protein
MPGTLNANAMPARSGRTLTAFRPRLAMRAFLAAIMCLFGCAAVMVWHAAMADNFAKVYYDARKDKLVVTIFYRGTNPNHTFSLKWGPCTQSTNGKGRAIDAEVLDSQWQDGAQQNFTKTTQFDLSDLQCRPATLSLRTAPRFYSTVQIPAASIPAH